MTPRQGAGVSFSVLTVALVLAWQITKPEDRGHRPRVKPVVGAASASETRQAPARASRPSGSRPSRPASRVARRPRARTDGSARIIGRVVTHRDRIPATGAQVKAVFAYPGRPREVTTIVASGADGRFATPVPPGDEPGSALLEFTSAKGFGKTEIDVFAPFSGTTDVGDVELSSMRKVWFHVTAADLTPIADACALPGPGAGAVTRSDSAGNGVIESAFAIGSIRFVAPGFEPLAVPVPAEEDSLEVRLSAAVTARIRITTAAGEPGAIITSIETPPDAYFVQPGDPFWSPLGNTRVVGRSSRVQVRPHGVAGDLLTFQSSTITLGPLRPGTLLSILVREILKGRTFRKEVKLPAAGVHDVEFALPGDFGVVAGRVLDAAGTPVAGATVSLLKTPVTRGTDRNGEFSFGAVPADVYDLMVSSKAHARWRRAEHPVEKDAKPLAITMETGVTVTVTVLDQEGMPFHGAAVSALDRSGRTDAKGRVQLHHLPVALVAFEATSGGRMKVLERHTSSPDVTIQLQEDEDR